jgi:hypothetical protein
MAIWMFAFFEWSQCEGAWAKPKELPPVQISTLAELEVMQKLCTHAHTLVVHKIGGTAFRICADCGLNFIRADQ